MRVVMMMRDREYRDALIERMTGFDKDIFIEIAGSTGIRRDAVIVTDIRPEEIEQSSLHKIQSRTLFLTNTPATVRTHAGGGADHPEESSSIQEYADDNSPHMIFKYSGTGEILSELTLLYSLWSGDTGSITPSTRLIAVAGESDEHSASRCRALAGQIMYRHGGSILILPLGYINDYADSEDDGSEGWFRRLMYMIDNGRDFAPESFTFTDSYGVSYLRLPQGINPLSGLSEEYLNKLTARFCRYFGTVILDIGTCLSPVNLMITRAADNILFFGSGRRIGDISGVLGEKTMERVRVIGIGDRSSEELIMDDCVSELYGRDDQETDNTALQNRDR